MKNLLVIHQSAELYGSDKTLLLFLEGLDKSIFFPVVILPSDGPLKIALENSNITVYIAPVLKLYRKIFTPGNLLSFIRDIKTTQRFLAKLHQQYCFTIVYSNTLAVLAGLFFSKRHHLKHVWHVHEIIVHPKLIAALYPKILNRFAQVIICNSAATRENLTERLPALKNKCVIVYNGLNASTPDGFNAANKNSEHKDTITVTLIGRISRLKGHKWLLSTYINFLKSKNIKLLFVGSPVEGQEYYLDEVNKIITENGLETEITVMDFTQNLETVWQATDIAVMPSTEAESFGLVALEAMLRKKPVIASNHGGVTEIVVDKQTGLLVSPGNEEALAKAILTLAFDEKKRESFGLAGYERAAAKFSLQNYIDGITHVLNI
ncbi:glycosyltransferase family 4 protein [Flavobacterium rhizosphaerae]|uniref:Glycosyltransferase family 4 protein n=1 Tax=Flavobacterium rhizosphaerae TaxID=3163298 RepID=A0ABW8YXZ5_9FLAO